MSYGHDDEAMGVNHREAKDYREKLAQYEEPDYDVERSASFMGEDDRAVRPSREVESPVPSRIPDTGARTYRSVSFAGSSGEGVLDPWIAASLQPNRMEKGHLDVDLGRSLNSTRRLDQAFSKARAGAGPEDMAKYSAMALRAVDAGRQKGEELTHLRNLDKDDAIDAVDAAESMPATSSGVAPPQKRRGLWGSWLGRGLSKIGRGIKGLFGRRRR